MTTKKTIAEELAELRAMHVPELVLKYEELFGKPPRNRNREHLWRRCAWRVQELKLGGLSTVAKAEIDRRIGELDIPQLDDRRVRVEIAKAKRQGDPVVGTTLTRTWRGQEIRTTALDGGRWEYDGVVYRSLSGLAKALTGSHMSGRAFFRLAAKEKAR